MSSPQRRRCARVAVLATVVLAVFGGGPAQARTIRVNWTDSQPWGGGHVIYRTTKIWVHGSTFSVTASVTNRSKYQIRFFPSGPYDPTRLRPPGFGIAFRPVAQHGVIQTRTLRSVPARTFSPSLLFPRTLGVGKTWTGTFSGRSPLLRTHRTWWVTFGLVVPWKGKHALSVSTIAGPHGSYWVSDKTFST
ncbi:MAG TPA: hypothetical protein VGJ77_07615 [Gaiellaceae bacterium]|jgi:hypothetical protein